MSQAGISSVPGGGGGGGGLTWVNVTGTSQQIARGHGYAANNAGLVTLALPLPGGVQFGDTIAVMGVGAGGWKVTQGAGQQIIIGASSTTIGATGFIQATTTTDAIELVCGPDNLTWRCVMAPEGNPTVS